MAQVRCPKCGAAAEVAIGTPFCAQCGWNREAAVRRLQRMSWLLPALIVFFDLFGIIGVGFVMKNWPGAILLATLPTLLLGFVYAGARQGLAKLRAPATQTTVSSATANLSATAQASVNQDKVTQYDFLISLPSPRPVRLGSRGKLSMTVVLLITFAAEALLFWNLYGIWQRTRSFRDFHGSEIFMLCAVALIASFPFFVRHKMIRDHDLLENGIVAMGRVTSQRNFKNNSAITYEFTDASGKTISRRANDLTHSFYEGMTVPVFYDPQDSERQVAACASFFEIVNPSGQ